MIVRTTLVSALICSVICRPNDFLAQNTFPENEGQQYLVNNVQNQKPQVDLNSIDSNDVLKKLFTEFLTQYVQKEGNVVQTTTTATPITEKPVEHPIPNFQSNIPQQVFTPTFSQPQPIATKPVRSKPSQLTFTPTFSQPKPTKRIQNHLFEPIPTTPKPQSNFVYVKIPQQDDVTSTQQRQNIIKSRIAAPKVQQRRKLTQPIPSTSVFNTEEQPTEVISTNNLNSILQSIDKSAVTKTPVLSKSPVVSVNKPVSVSEKVKNQERFDEAEFRKQAENAKYEFASAIDDNINGNLQIKEEVRDGLAVRGKYAFSDGYYMRTVHYEADDKGYRVVKEEVVPLEGPQIDPNGHAKVNTYVDGNSVINYQITRDDIQPSIKIVAEEIPKFEQEDVTNQEEN